MPTLSDRPCKGSPFRGYDGATGCLLMAGNETFGRAELAASGNAILTFSGDKSVIVASPDVFFQEVAKGRARVQAQLQMDWWKSHGRRLGRR